MSKIKDAFTKGKAFIPFISAGDHGIENTERYIRIMVKAGADMVEIGIPFSDPTAEGPVIQEASTRAFEEKSELASVAHKHGVEVVSLIAPTSENRIEMIAKDAEGFVYCVSSLGVTGMRSEIKTDIKSIVEMIRKYTDIPVAVGFGISKPEQAEAMARVSDGAIVGSAIVKIVAEQGEHADQALFDYVQSMKQAVLKASV